jgi:hypothetical protein
MPEQFLIRVSPTGKAIFVGGAAEDINELPTPELLGEKIVDKTIASRQLREVGGYTVTQGTLRAGSLVFEAILRRTQEYRETVLNDLGFLYDVDAIDRAFSEFYPDEERVGNIINTFQVNGRNSYQLLYDGTGYFAGGKFSWDFNNDHTDFEVTVDGTVIARAGKLIDLDIDGTVSIGLGEITGGDSNLTYTFDSSGIFIQDFITSSNVGSISIDSRTILMTDLVGTDVKKTDIRGGWFYMDDTLFGETILTPGTILLLDPDDAGINLLVDENGLFSSRGAEFSGNVSVANATDNNHALNRVTADGRYLQLANTQTVTGNKTFSGTNVHSGGNTFSGTSVFTGINRITNKSVQQINESDSPFTVTGEEYIDVDASITAITINLPAGTAGRRITIYDGFGNAGTNNITIQRAGSDTINAGTSVVINSNRGYITLIYTNEWKIVNRN